MRPTKEAVAEAKEQGIAIDEKYVDTLRAAADTARPSPVAARPGWLKGRLFRAAQSTSDLAPLSPG